MTISRIKRRRGKGWRERGREEEKKGRRGNRRKYSEITFLGMSESL